jgi:hypothetical protein
MPLGGYCRACRRWVWLNTYGECQFGHPASAVSDVQQLKPREGDEQTQLTIDAARSFALRRRSGPAAAWRHSLWIVFTLPFGLLSWLAFVYIGLRARRVEWLVAGIIYAVPPILVAAFHGTALFWPLVAVALTTWVISILHAVLVRGQYRAVMLAGGPAGLLPAAPEGSYETERLALPSGLDADVVHTLEAAQATVDEIAATGHGIDAPPVRARVEMLCRTAQRILAELRDDPRRLSLARAFLTYYLEAAGRIVAGYADLAGKRLDPAQVEPVLERAIVALDTVQQAFDRELVNLALSDVIDLDAEIALLETTARMEPL